MELFRAIPLGLVPLRNRVKPSTLLRRQHAVNTHEHGRAFLADRKARHFEPLGRLQQLALARIGPLHQLRKSVCARSRSSLSPLSRAIDPWTILSISADCSAVSLSSCLYFSVAHQREGGRGAECEPSDL